MDAQAKKLLDEIPVKAFRSKLEPHFELIRELRRKRRTYREIAQILRDRLQVSVAHSTVQAFVKVRSRHTDQPRLDLTGASAQEANTLGAPSPDDPIASLRSKSRKATAPAPPQPKFQYTEGEPLRFDPDFQKED